MQKSESIAAQYVYCHFNNEHGVFYVGKGSGKRMFVTGNRSLKWRECVRNNGFQAIVLSFCEDKKSAFFEERRWISVLKKAGQCSANVSLGGEGVTVEKRWWGMNISKSLTGRSLPKGEDARAYKYFCDKETLRRLYEDNMLSVIKIGNIYGVSETTVCNRLKSYGIDIRDIKKRGKKIICTTTGAKFPSITVAARHLGLFRENIRKVLAGKYAHTGGFSFKYMDGEI